MFKASNFGGHPRNNIRNLVFDKRRLFEFFLHELSYSGKQTVDNKTTLITLI